MDCTIEEKSLVNAVFQNCKFIRCKIRACDMRLTVFRDSGLWSACIIESNDFTKTIIGDVKIEKTIFSDNRFEKVTFDGTELKDVTFKGSVKSVWFYGIPQAKDLYKQILFFKKASSFKTPTINFEQAYLDDVVFSRGLDLSKTIFPHQKNLKLVHQPKNFFLRFLKKTKEVFSDEESVQFCTYLVDNVLYRPDQQGMPIVLLDLGQFYSSANVDRDQRIVELLMAG